MCLKVELDVEVLRQKEEVEASHAAKKANIALAKETKHEQRAEIALAKEGKDDEKAEKEIFEAERAHQQVEDAHARQLECVRKADEAAKILQRH